MTGTLLNALAVAIGGTLGVLVGARFPTRMQESIFAVLGLFTLTIGIANGLETGNPLIVLVSLTVGVLIGELVQLEARLEQFGEWLKRRLLSSGSGSGSRFVEGFVTASLVFCVGPLTIQGAIEDGLLGDYSLLAIKSVLDGFAALAFATTLGVGVLASIIVILLFQGGISLLASLGADIFSVAMIAEMTATGGVVLLAISLRLLDLKAVRAANFLPALFVAPALVALLDWLGVNYYPL